MFLCIANTLLLAAIVWFLYQINHRMPTDSSLSGIRVQAQCSIMNDELDVKVKNDWLRVQIY
jgi:hypothetical protein